jgi:hypothetical protein
MTKPRRTKAKKQAPKAKASKQPRRTGMLADADDIAPRIGRPQFQATEKDRAFVKRMAALGANLDDIASTVGCERHTLVKHFRRDIDDGRIEATQAVAAALFAKATAKVVSGASVRAAEIWLRRHPEWLEAERPRDRDDEAGDREIVVVGGLPEPEAREIPADQEVAAGPAGAGEGS